MSLHGKAVDLMFTRWCRKGEWDSTMVMLKYLLCAGLGVMGHGHGHSVSSRDPARLAVVMGPGARQSAMRKQQGHKCTGDDESR